MHRQGRASLAERRRQVACLSIDNGTSDVNHPRSLEGSLVPPFFLFLRVVQPGLRGGLAQARDGFVWSDHADGFGRGVGVYGCDRRP